MLFLLVLQCVAAQVSVGVGGVSVGVGPAILPTVGLQQGVIPGQVIQQGIPGQVIQPGFPGQVIQQGPLIQQGVQPVFQQQQFGQLTGLLGIGTTQLAGGQTFGLSRGMVVGVSSGSIVCSVNNGRGRQELLTAGLVRRFNNRDVVCQSLGLSIVTGQI